MCHHSQQTGTPKSTNMAIIVRLLLGAVLAGLARAATADTAASSNFTESCTELVLKKSYSGLLSMLSASCVGLGGNTTATALHNSTLDLNLCLGIDHTTAHLAWSV